MRYRSLVVLSSMLVIGCGSQEPAAPVDSDAGSSGNSASGSESGGGPSTTTPSSTGQTDGTSSDASEDDGAGTGGSTTADSTGADSTGAAEDTGGSTTGDPIAPPDCPQLCADVSPDSCLDPASCEAQCSELLDGQAEEAHAAFAHCVATNPLCFSFLDGCIWSTLYPDPFEQMLFYVGTEFDAYEGMVVRGGISNGKTVDALTETTVENGALTLEFVATLSITAPRLVLLYVDVDQDGSCTPGVDFGAWGYIPVSGDFTNPIFEGGEPAPETSSDFVCESFDDV